MKIRIYSKRKTIAIVHSEEEAMRVIKEYKKQTNGGGATQTDNSTI